MYTLTHDILTHAMPRQLELAAADNYRQLAALEAVAWGGEVITRSGFTYTYAGALNGASVLFPRPAVEEAGVLLDGMMDYYRAHPPNGVGYWSLQPAVPEDIGVRLLARGFQPGWQPCWMALELSKLRDHFPPPPKLRIAADNDTDISHIGELPYSANNNILTPTIRRSHPELAQRFIGTQGRSIVAQSAVFYTAGELGVAGIYNVGVAPALRGKGAGKAITLAACHHARARGYRYAVLNATPDGRRIYEQLGFEWVGDGLTWWLMGNRYITHPPTAKQVAAAEAIGRGDTDTLNALAGGWTPAQWQAPMANGLRWMELAAHCKQPACAEWMLAHGAPCTTLDAWELGWKDRAAILLAQDPEEVNRPYGEGQLTLLHIAAQRGDTALAELALSFHPDLQRKDSWHNGIPLGWAHYFNRTDIIALIQAWGGHH